MEKEKKLRSRLWGGIIYPESAPENWKEDLQESGYYGFISPLHDKDPRDGMEEGEEDYYKKPHFHIMIIEKNAIFSPDEFFKSIGAAGNPEKIHDKAAYARYLCHLDEKGKKAKYSKADVEQFGDGEDYETVINKIRGWHLRKDKKSAEEKKAKLHETLLEMRHFIKENKIISYAYLCDIAEEEEDFNKWFEILDNPQRMRLIIEYINSLRADEEMKTAKKYQK